MSYISSPFVLFLCYNSIFLLFQTYFKIENHFVSVLYKKGDTLLVAGNLKISSIKEILTELNYIFLHKQESMGSFLYNMQYFNIFVKIENKTSVMTVNYDTVLFQNEKAHYDLPHLNL